MKKLIAILLFASLLRSAFAQAPEKISYQAVIRNASDNLVTSSPVGMRLSILQGSEVGTAVYVETQTPTTNASGLISIAIGMGTVVTGTLSTIDWSAGLYYIKTETDPTGGTSYSISGTTQLLSVPYALHAKTANNGITTAQANAITANTAKVGITTAQADAITANTAKVGITTAQANAITANTAKVGVTPGTQAGQMQYWNGSAWVTVAAGNSGQILSFIGGVPTWITASLTTAGPTDVYNPTTGKIWMDRNLGATQVATSSTDAAAYGYLYQWGRGTDGHQIRTSATTGTLSSSDTPGHGNFIRTNSTYFYDWRSPQNANLWQGVNGINNPCPSGYRLPTETELEAERLSWSANTSAAAYASPLKWPLGAGLRSLSDGALYGSVTDSYYWSSTVSGTDSRRLSLFSSDAYMFTHYRAVAISVRCIKD